MSTALWVIFWVLAVLLGSLLISLVIAAFIRVGGSGGCDEELPRVPRPVVKEPAPPPKTPPFDE
ncbi:hypothetical protein SAMN05443637_105160 [Pseudonocardia thermophila]|uniref:Uncharacterized protein n=1 Tax=Pseudonocardia thermophila TaxID=1848 RepID=A0A1M6RU51_PSETH|nr:hypothetical protein [Pseudonocardia thermophila]SHK36041.1 hypothetical protein SAMN05443637_105160 [Pseudonocardia thermophila]